MIIIMSAQIFSQTSELNKLNVRTSITLDSIKIIGFTDSIIEGDTLHIPTSDAVYKLSSTNENYTFSKGLTLLNGDVTLGGSLGFSNAFTDVGFGEFKLFYTDGIQSYFKFKKENFSVSLNDAFGQESLLDMNMNATILRNSYGPNFSEILINHGTIQLEATGNLKFDCPRIELVFSSVYLGLNAGLNNDSDGLNNIGIGWNALKENDAGISNTAIGYGVLQSNLSDNNTGLGNSALWSNTTGYDNTAIGQSALALNITGTDNTAIGKSALYYSNGASNTALGYSAGQNLNDGTSQNTNPVLGLYLGYGTRASANNNSNEIVLGSNAKGKGTNKAVVGDDNITDIYMNENGTATIHAANVGSLIEPYFNLFLGDGVTTEVVMLCGEPNLETPHLPIMSVYRVSDSLMMNIGSNIAHSDIKVKRGASNFLHVTFATAPALSDTIRFMFINP